MAAAPIPASPQAEAIARDRGALLRNSRGRVRLCLHLAGGGTLFDGGAWNALLERRRPRGRRCEGADHGGECDNASHCVPVPHVRSFRRDRPNAILRREPSRRAVNARLIAVADRQIRRLQVIASATGRMTVEFRILGSLDVLVDGRPVPLGGARQRAVLAILLLHRGEAVSVERVVDQIWASGRRTLRLRRCRSMSRGFARFLAKAFWSRAAEAMRSRSTPTGSTPSASRGSPRMGATPSSGVTPVMPPSS